MRFRPKEILFSPTENCNLSCGHCAVKKSKNTLSQDAAKKFLASSAKIGVNRVGFTGGEPFLALDFLCEMTAEAVRKGFLFDKIMTNAVWWADEPHLQSALRRLFEAGYDGDICVSFDAFHRQDVKKVARFVKAAVSMWRRPDIVSIAFVRGARDNRTRSKLKALGKLLDKNVFVRKFPIDLSAIGKAERLKKPWDGRWFKEDYCKGPGNVFFIEPSGDVKPCCGYASFLKELTIGNIGKDSPRAVMKNIRKNRFLCAIFNRGLVRIRRDLERRGVKFPGRTSNHCYYCHYMLTKIPGRTLEECLKR